jgi:hypothetical protein
MNDAATTVPPSRNEALILVRGIAGAIAGGVLGYFAFRFLSSQGFYGLMIPGLLVGLGAGWAARQRSQILGIVCALGGLALMIVAEWLRSPMLADKSLLYFVTHLHQMDGATVKIAMLALGTAAAWWFGRGR